MVGSSLRSDYQGLDRPLEEWRSELGIVPVTTGQWSWYSRSPLQEALSSAG